MKVVLSSSIVLVHPSTQHSGNSPWIARLLEIEGKTRIFHPLFEDENEYLLSSNHNYFNLHNHFQLCYLSVSYHIRENQLFEASQFEHDKVLVFNLPKYQSFPCSIKDCSRLSLSKQGRLFRFRPLIKEEGIYDISYGSVDKFDDIICFKGIVYALDRLGRLYKISVDTFRVQKVVIDKAIVKEVSTIRGYKKRLVGSILDERLYLIVRNDLEDELRVYKMMMSFNKKKRYWIEVQSFEDDDQVLFLSRVDAYFVDASEFSMCNLENCIIFYDAFPLYFHTSRKFHKKVKIEKEIQVFWLGRNNQNFRPISSYPNFPAANFFSPPNWVLQTYLSTFHQSPSQSECSNDKKTKHNLRALNSAMNMRKKARDLFNW